VQVDDLRDEADNRILECALAGRADLIVTGDRAMLDLAAWRGARIVTVAAYLDE
jgi:predicted nucleic acid-binding protein